MNKDWKLIVLLTAAFFLASRGFAQDGTVSGKVVTPNNDPIENVVITVLETNIPSVRTNAEGKFSIKLPEGKVYILRFTHSTFQPAQWELRVQKAGLYNKTIKMEIFSVDDVAIQGKTNLPQMQGIPIGADETVTMPTVSPSIESILPTLSGGVSKSNEFSSQYRVRGGNFDENLVYVNGIEIYRPFLVRSGQQEGLGFTNPQLADNVSFSTGGFSARYGDKLSSVLDITYRDPREFRATAEVGIITTNLHAEGRTVNKKQPEKPGRWGFIGGARRFNTTYLLNSLDTQGDYMPNFIDVQGMATFVPRYNEVKMIETRKKDGSMDTTYLANEKLKLTFFGTFSRNRYIFEPSGRETEFGTIQSAFRLRTAFEGRELTSYSTGMGAIMLEHKPNVLFQQKLIVSGFQTEEAELFDVEGGYLLSEVNTSFGSDEFGEDAFLLGVGTEFKNGRNYLTASVASGQYIGEWSTSNSRRHRLMWGLQYERQMIEDDLKEYSLFDSAGYVVGPTGQFGVEEYIRGSAKLNTNNYKAWFQHEWYLDRAKKFLIVSGVRTVYNDLIEEFMVSPRVQLMYDNTKENGLRLRLASGVYQQAPFYREYRRLDGSLKTDLKPQRSIHYIAGLDYNFKAWGRPFELFAEGYYKQLDNLIPYEFQNVRIRYYPDRLASGYAYGADARVSGEFIKGIDSWITIGFLKTEEDVVGDTVGFVPRPTDQRFSFSMYFQDELPMNPTYKVHVNYVYNSGIRFGPPTVFEQRTSFGFPEYHRVDIGFSKLLTFKGKEERRFKHGIESIWATLEIFNLFQRENTVAYTWIQDLFDRQFAVPNHLSTRLLNVRVVMKFN